MGADSSRLSAGECLGSAAVQVNLFEAFIVLAEEPVDRSLGGSLWPAWLRSGQ